MKENIQLKVASGILLIIIGISFLISDFVIEEREKTFSRVNLELNELLVAETLPVTSEEASNEDNFTVSIDNTLTDEDNQYEVFAGTLEIPKINFSKGFYKKGSELNNVKFNLKILDVSNYPDENKGNVIIIGHSGNYSNSYFGNLYQLTVGDMASIQYRGKKYTYKIVNIYDENKDGTVTIYRDETKSCLTLITCTKDDNTKQTVYISELFSIE